MAVWLLILLLLGGLIYLNQVGLPDLLKKPLLEKLRARGLDLQFSRLRLSFSRGIVADRVRFGSSDHPLSPNLTLAEVQVQLNARALWHRQLQVDSLMLRQGRLAWPVVEPGRRPRQLTVEDIQTELRFLPDDQWVLDRFQARFAGANIQLMGNVNHASAVRDWKIFQSRGAAPAGSWGDRVRQWADTLERIHFSAPPELDVNVRGDARDLQSFNVRLSLSAPGARTPWGRVRQARFAARLFAATNELSRAVVRLDAGEAQTPWASATDLHMTLQLASLAEQTNVVNADLRLRLGAATTRWASARRVDVLAHVAPAAGQSNLVNGEIEVLAQQAVSQWAGVTNARLTAQWTHSLTNPVPLAGQGRLRCETGQSRWASGDGIQFVTHFTQATNRVPSDASWAWWAALAPYGFDWDLRLDRLRLTEGVADMVACAGSWRAPELTLTNFEAVLYERRVQAGATLDVATRRLRAQVASDADPHKIEPLLTEGARRWLSDYWWNDPPSVRAEAALVLPAWTNRQPDWRAEVQPTLYLAGEFAMEQGGGYRQVPVSAARSHFVYSNQCWHLPDLLLVRPEGRIRAEHRANDLTKDFYWRLESTADLRVLRPVLEPPQQKGLDFLTFGQPPDLQVEIWGRFHEHERVGLKGRVALTNFTFRGQSASGLQTEFQYTNLVLQCIAPHLQRGEQRLSADGLTADFREEKVFLTNGFSTAEPLAVARAIGPHIGRAIEPYRFTQPPTVRAYGIIPMHGEEDADLHFQVQGGPFRWMKFNIPHLSGHVHWAGLRLSLSDVRAFFYGGDAAGSATFYFGPQKGTDFQFAMTTTNTVLQLLMGDLSAHTNKLEGLLSGNLVVSHANSEDWRATEGYGRLDLRNGLIWDIPLFGVFSPVLDGIAPGLGTSRASAATCSFALTNGVVRSDDLEIRSPALRLQYRGTVDLEGQVKARVEAELLRDVWVLGPIVSTVFWPVTKMFEYKVTGPLADPKTEPVYLVPKILTMPFHPFRTLKGLFPDEGGGQPKATAPPRRS